MLASVRANLWLLVLSLLVSCILYPLALWGIAQAFFPEQANGSLILDSSTGQALGSRLIGQPFTRAEYFQPRPSAAGSGYNGAVSGASNYGASNPLLRARVAQQLGPIVSYEGPSPTGHTVQTDIEVWFAQWANDHPNEEGGVVAKWADTYSSAAAAWVKSDDPHKEHVKAWMMAHPEAVTGFIKSHPGNPEPQPEDMAVDFFKDYGKTHPGRFPSYAAPAGGAEKTWQDLAVGPDIQAYFFDRWLQEHTQVRLRQVPADMLMASSSGLDPDITLANALYQLDRVAEAWAKIIDGDADTNRLNRKRAQLKVEIGQMLTDRASAPLGGLVGVKLINVLEMNLALRERYDPKVQAHHATGVPGLAAR